MPAVQIKAPQPALTSSAGLLAIAKRSENVFTRPGPKAASARVLENERLLARRAGRPSERKRTA